MRGRVGDSAAVRRELHHVIKSLWIVVFGQIDRERAELAGRRDKADRRRRRTSRARIGPDRRQRAWRAPEARQLLPGGVRDRQREAKVPRWAKDGAIVIAIDDAYADAGTDDARRKQADREYRSPDAMGTPPACPKLSRRRSSRWRVVGQLRQPVVQRDHEPLQAESLAHQHAMSEPFGGGQFQARLFEDRRLVERTVVV